MPVVQIPGLKINYEGAGEGDKKLLLVHGNFGSWRWWKPLLEDLPEGFCAYAPDLRGCGDTEKPSGGHSILQLSEDIYHFARTLGWDSFHLIGHSLGGAVALQLALDHSESVQTLMLVSPAPPGGLKDLQRSGYRGLWIPKLFNSGQGVSMNSLDAGYRVLQGLKINRPLMRQALSRMTPTLLRDREFDALVNDACKMSPEAVTGHIAALENWNVEDDLKVLSQPVVILWGKKDPLVPIPALKHAEGMIPNCKLIIWRDVGHGPQLEQPLRFKRLVSGYIDRHSKSKGKITGGWLDFFRKRLK